MTDASLPDCLRVVPQLVRRPPSLPDSLRAYPSLSVVRCSFRPRQSPCDRKARGKGTRGHDGGHRGSKPQQALERSSNCCTQAGWLDGSSAGWARLYDTLTTSLRLAHKVHEAKNGSYSERQRDRSVDQKRCLGGWMGGWLAGPGCMIRLKLRSNKLTRYTRQNKNAARIIIVRSVDQKRCLGSWVVGRLGLVA